MFVHVSLICLTQDVPELPKAHKRCESKADRKHCDHHTGVNLYQRVGVATAVDSVVDQGHLGSFHFAGIVHLACQSLEERARDRWKQELDDLCRIGCVGEWVGV